MQGTREFLGDPPRMNGQQNNCYTGGRFHRTYLLAPINAPWVFPFDLATGILHRSPAAKEPTSGSDAESIGQRDVRCVRFRNCQCGRYGSRPFSSKVRKDSLAVGSFVKPVRFFRWIPCLSCSGPPLIGYRIVCIQSDQLWRSHRAFARHHRGQTLARS